MQDSNQAIALRKWLGAHGAGLVVTAAFLLYGARLFQLISVNAVNIFFSDQWEFNDATACCKR